MVCGNQASRATLLFDPSMSALDIAILEIIDALSRHPRNHRRSKPPSLKSLTLEAAILDTVVELRARFGGHL